MRIVVLMGGDSSEREISLVTGDQVARTMEENGHEVIKVDPAGIHKEQAALNKTDQHFIGIDYPGSDLLPLHRGSQYLKNITMVKRLKPDLVFIALHGGKGENGVIQGMLDSAEIPYTGSGQVASVLAMQKDISKLYFRSANIPFPRGIVLDRKGASRKKLKKIQFPQVIKPTDQGSTIGFSIAQNQSELDTAIDEAFKLGNKVIVEDYIAGKEIAIGIIKNRALPAIEIIPKHDIYDYECKYNDGMSSYIVPANIEEKRTHNLQNLALKAHRLLGCKGYSRVDFRVTEAGEPFILEVNTLPGMTPTSLLPKAANAAGINFNSLVEIIIEEAVKE